LEGFDLHESELDFGHVTLISAGDKWFSAFNFLTQRGRALSLLKKANEFREASVVARTKGHSAVVVDTLFSACELASSGHGRLQMPAPSGGGRTFGMGAKVACLATL
jgi:hypothetical protein